ncbi:OmpH family outer membrane protein [Vibrio neptunius]|uniref:OmpH family outer membrane protein n=1 Tax=Vibrio neptunius TaxID=170651 RepID=UPI0019D20AD6|nr:OmpH family outer membrane protein [Vibrio neptunius]MBN3572508.1 OmpH family outer membrane protein [Vibrio neptunius]QXX07983.1 OmpH family outer membrane protein [Vibrio neptunius]
MIKAAGLSLVVMSSSFFANAAEAAQKIGYINTAQVFQALPQREVVLQKMQEEFKDKAGELKSIQAKANTKLEKFNRDKELMSSEDREQLRIEITQLNNELKLQGQAFEKAQQRREMEEKQKLFKLIQGAVKKVAEKEGYDMIVDIQTMQYGKPEYNISEQVINSLK